MAEIVAAQCDGFIEVNQIRFPQPPQSDRLTPDPPHMFSAQEMRHAVIGKLLEMAQRQTGTGPKDVVFVYNGRWPLCIVWASQVHVMWTAWRKSNRKYIGREGGSQTTSFWWTSERRILVSAHTNRKARCPSFLLFLGKIPATSCLSPREIGRNIEKECSKSGNEGCGKTYVIRTSRLLATSGRLCR